LWLPSEDPKRYIPRGIPQFRLSVTILDRNILIMSCFLSLKVVSTFFAAKAFSETFSRCCACHFFIIGLWNHFLEEHHLPQTLKFGMVDWLDSKMSVSQQAPLVGRYLLLRLLHFPTKLEVGWNDRLVNQRHTKR
jgi:hypothetical protein